MFTSTRSLFVAAFFACVPIVGCDNAEPSAAEVQRCSDYCTACMVGPCIAAGESGYCQGPSMGTTRRACILESNGDCAIVSSCIAEMRDSGIGR